MDITGVDDCTQLAIAVKQFKEHDNRRNNMLVEALVGARNEHALDVRDYGNFLSVVKGVASAISGNPTHSNQDLFPRPMNKPGKKQRIKKRRKLLEASDATSSFNSLVNNNCNLD